MAKKHALPDMSALEALSNSAFPKKPAATAKPTKPQVDVNAKKEGAIHQDQPQEQTVPAIVEVKTQTEPKAHAKDAQTEEQLSDPLTTGTNAILDDADYDIVRVPKLFKHSAGPRAKVQIFFNAENMEALNALIKSTDNDMTKAQGIMEKYAFPALRAAAAKLVKDHG